MVPTSRSTTIDALCYQFTPETAMVHPGKPSYRGSIVSPLDPYLGPTRRQQCGLLWGIRMSKERTIERGATAQHDSEHACPLCDQTVPHSELVEVSVGDTTDQLCAFCASSLFEDVDAPEPGEDPSPRDVGSTPADRAVAPASTDSDPSTVSWAPMQPDRGGVLGTILTYHYLSLSLLWAIHRTNVRLIERVIEEVDVQLIAVLTLVLSTIGILVPLLVPG